MDRDTAVKIFNLITEGHPVGVDGEGNIVSDNTELGTVLHVLGKPNYIRRERIKDGGVRKTILPNGVPYDDPYDWNTKDAAAWLREWADALDPPAPLGAEMLARQTALDYHGEHSYTPKTQEEATLFVPHRWVLEAMRRAYIQGRGGRYADI